MSEEYVSRCHEELYSSKNKDALTYLMVTRAFKPETIKAYRFGYDVDKLAIVIPRYSDTGKKLNGVKFRHLHPACPSKYTYAKGSRASLYNSHSMKDPVVPEIVITEGEFDCASVFQYASRVPVVATPGMNTFKDSWIKSFEPFRKIYIAFDNEDSANERAVALAEKLKSYRCYRVVLPEGIKDINELVVKTGEATARVWNQLLEDARCLGVPLIKETDEYKNEAVNSYLEGEEMTVSTGHPALDKCFGGFQPGRVYLIKGNTKIGKTTFVLDMLMNAAQKGNKVLLGSFEMKPAQEMIVKIVSKLLGKDIEEEPRLNKEQLIRAIDYIHHLGTVSWINRYDHVKLSELYDAVKIKYEDGFRLLMLDHAQFLMNLGSDKDGAVFTQTARVSKFIKKLTNDFPKLTIIAITELNNNEGTMGGKTLEYDSDAVLNYYGSGLTCEKHRLGGGKYKDKSVQIRWNRTTCSYTVS